MVVVAVVVVVVTAALMVAVAVAIVGVVMKETIDAKCSVVKMHLQILSVVSQ